MDSKDFTEYLTEFASVNVDAMNSQNTQNSSGTQNIVREEENVKNDDSLEYADFEQFSVGEKQVDEAQIREEQETGKPLVPSVQVSSFDRACIKTYEISEKASESFKGVRKSLRRISNKYLSRFTVMRNKKFFEKGELVIAGDFKFLLRDNQLMLLKYTGTANKVVVPDEVGGVPVEYVHWTAFNKGRFATTTRIKNVWQILKSDEAGVYNSQTIKRASLWIETLQLPKYLKFIPDNLFSCCPSLRTIEIPENVTSIAPSAFAESKLRNVLISGPMIENLGFVKFGDDINVFCAKDCINAYKGVLM